jgi:hypothetical protein
MSPRTTRALLGVALLLTLLAAWFAPPDDSVGVAASEAGPAGTKRGASMPPLAGKERRSAAAPFVDVLRIRARALEDGDDAPDAILFSSTQWSPPATVTAAAAPTPVAAAAPAQAPPLPFRVLGSYERAGQTVVFLQQNDQNHVVRVGDTIADTYKVESLDDAVMKLRYLPLDQIQTLELGRTLKEK